MSPDLLAWAHRHRVPQAAVAELQAIIGVDGTRRAPDLREGASEGAAASHMRLAAARAGYLCWRNNVGAYKDKQGRQVRYGLANDSAQLNEEYKSSDYVGGRPRLVTPDMVGSTILQLWVREMKPVGWYYTGTGREPAQLRFIELVLAHGGDAAFSTGGI